MFKRILFSAAITTATLVAAGCGTSLHVTQTTGTQLAAAAPMPAPLAETPRSLRERPASRAAAPPTHPALAAAQTAPHETDTPPRQNVPPVTTATTTAPAVPVNPTVTVIYTDGACGQTGLAEATEYHLRVITGPCPTDLAPPTPPTTTDDPIVTVEYPTGQCGTTGTTEAAELHLRIIDPATCQGGYVITTPGPAPTPTPTTTSIPPTN